jgi:hypothetical protein
MTADRVDPIPDEVLTALVRQAVTVGMTVGLAPVPAPPPGMVARMPALVANGRRMFAAGVNLIAGTDAGYDPTSSPSTVTRSRIRPRCTPSARCTSALPRSPADPGLRNGSHRQAWGTA